MTVIIRKGNKKNTAKVLSGLIQKRDRKGNLKKHFGQLKRGIDGLDYQNEVRKNED
jgi:hypothetical protein